MTRMITITIRMCTQLPVFGNFGKNLPPKAPSNQSTKRITITVHIRFLLFCFPAGNHTTQRANNRCPRNPAGWTSSFLGPLFSIWYLRKIIFRSQEKATHLVLHRLRWYQLATDLHLWRWKTCPAARQCSQGNSIRPLKNLAGLQIGRAHVWTPVTAS